MSELFYNKINSYEAMPEEEIDNAIKFCEGYKNFLTEGKTASLSVKYLTQIAKKNGYMPFEYNKKYEKGDKIFFSQKGKAAIFALIGDDFEEGFNITVSHVDCPRIDIKGSPLYEDGNVALLKTHYYGGLKKYQWTALPLAIVGEIYKKDGTCIEVSFGLDDTEPVLCITDILPHLGQTQGKKPLDSAFTGEDLNVLIGSIPDVTEENDKIKANILKILNKKYDIIEEDFLTADLSVVPTEKARDLGFDRSMIISYGQDDRVCAYPTFKALMNHKTVSKTALCILADREEVGSMGITGLRSNYMFDFMTELCINSKKNPRQAFANSEALSTDVSPAFDPTYPDVYEKKNSAFINFGITFNKFTGRGGKVGASEADAKYIAKILSKFNKEHILYQFAELGKVDQGGGGTVSQYIADRNIEVVDLGVPILSMHAPYEVTAKNDVYMLYKAVLSFYK